MTNTLLQWRPRRTGPRIGRLQRWDSTLACGGSNPPKTYAQILRRGGVLYGFEDGVLVAEKLSGSFMYPSFSILHFGP